MQMRISPIIIVFLLAIGAKVWAGQQTVATTLSPREQLQQYIAQLQANPSDDALREKAIQLALTLNPKPTTPPEVDELVGKAKYAFQHASSEADFLAAADAFNKAAILAPWVPDYYNNAAVSFEAAKQPDSAVKYFRWYLLAAPNASDASKVREHIGELEYAEAKQRAELEAKVEERKKYFHTDHVIQVRLIGVNRAIPVRVYLGAVGNMYYFLAPEVIEPNGSETLFYLLCADHDSRWGETCSNFRAFRVGRAYTAHLHLGSGSGEELDVIDGVHTGGQTYAYVCPSGDYQWIMGDDGPVCHPH